MSHATNKRCCHKDRIINMGIQFGTDKPDEIFTSGVGWGDYDSNQTNDLGWGDMDARTLMNGSGYGKPDNYLSDVMLLIPNDLDGPRIVRAPPRWD